jgi:hypothetical protein
MAGDDVEETGSGTGRLDELTTGGSGATHARLLVTSRGPKPGKGIEVESVNDLGRCRGIGKGEDLRHAAGGIPHLSDRK